MQQNTFKEQPIKAVFTCADTDSTQ